MPYKKKGHMAIRVRSGQQLLVVSQLGSFKKNTAGVQECVELWQKEAFWEKF